jgi:hypothetical protein
VLAHAADVRVLEGTFLVSVPKRRVVIAHRVVTIAAAVVPTLEILSRAFSTFAAASHSGSDLC